VIKLLLWYYFIVHYDLFALCLEINVIAMVDKSKYWYLTLKKEGPVHVLPINTLHYVYNFFYKWWIPSTLCMLCWYIKVVRHCYMVSLTTVNVSCGYLLIIVTLLIYSRVFPA
jgi:hypothetical protein